MIGEWINQPFRVKQILLIDAFFNVWMRCRSLVSGYLAG